MVMESKKKKASARVICQDADENWTVSLAKMFYEKPTIFATAYKFNKRCFVHVEPDGEERVLVTLKTDKGVVEGEKIAKEFCLEVNDQQHRQDLQKQFGHLRDLIVEQAFKPVVDLKDKIK
jgi:His-Xaa-Ser system protein HxsD